MSNNTSILATAENETYKKAVADFKSKLFKKPQGPEYPAIMVVGPSGSGKSNCFRNLPPDQTALINVEDKVFPFPIKPFEENYITGIMDSSPVEEALKMYKDDPRIKYIGMDSFTMYTNLLYDKARKVKQGWDIQNLHNDTLFEFFKLIKSIKNKFVIVTAIDELLSETTVTGASVRSRKAFVNGKKFEGKIEHQFTVVMFSEVKPIPGKPGEFDYIFNTNTDGTTAAKSPPNLKLARIIPNDIKIVCDAFEKSLLEVK